LKLIWEKENFHRLFLFIFQSEKAFYILNHDNLFDIEKFWMEIMLLTLKEYSVEIFIGWKGLSQLCKFSVKRFSEIPLLYLYKAQTFILFIQTKSIYYFFAKLFIVFVLCKIYLYDWILIFFLVLWIEFFAKKMFVAFLIRLESWFLENGNLWGFFFILFSYYWDFCNINKKVCRWINVWKWNQDKKVFILNLGWCDLVDANWNVLMKFKRCLNHFWKNLSLFQILKLCGPKSWKN
jgi:hypothetical protein